MKYKKRERLNIFFLFLIIILSFEIQFAMSSEIKLDNKIVDGSIEEKFDQKNIVEVMIELENISESDNFIAGLSESDSILYRQTSRKIGLKITEVGFDKLLNDPRVKAIYPGHVEIHAILDDSISIINADDVWTKGYNGNGVNICVIDSGVNASHPDLSGKISSEYCYCTVSEGVNSDCCPDGTDEDNDAEDNNGHGTHVVGIIASQDGTYKGVAYDSSIYVVKVLNSSGKGDLYDVGEGIEWCVNQGVDVISISIGNGGNHPGVSSCPSYINTEINLAYNTDIPVIIASGNEGYTTGINYPACSPNAISVGATTKVDNLAGYTNTENNILDLLAPGSDIKSLRWAPDGDLIGCTESGDYMTCSGTSMATPHVAGAIALLLEVDNSLTPNEIKTILQDTGENVSNWKRINILDAIDSLDGGGILTISNNGGYDLSVTSITDDRAWITSISPTSFIVSPSSSEEVNVVIDSSGYSPGTYSGTISIYSNDPDEDPKTVTVTMNVYCVDNDGDEYDDYDSTWCSSGTDCDDTDEDINPDADEICDDGKDNDCDGDTDGDDSDCDKADGESCTIDGECNSNYCDNDGVGASDDNWCFTPYNTYFDGEETTKCEYSTEYGISSCDENSVSYDYTSCTTGGYNYFADQCSSSCQGEDRGDNICRSNSFATGCNAASNCNGLTIETDLNTCNQAGQSYYEDECSSACNYQDITSVFECTDAGCSCTESLCDGLTTGSDITTCSSGQTYFADKCTSTAGGEDRGDNICRSSTFAATCTADSQCNSVEAGTGDCDEECNYIYNPLVISNLILNASDNPNNSTNANLTAYWNIESAINFKNITNWYLNNNSLTLLNFPFEGGSDSDYTRDYSILNNSGNVSGAVWSNNIGYDGFGAYTFNGTTDYIKVNDTNYLDFSEESNFTIEFRFKLNSIDTRQGLVSKNGNYHIRFFETNQSSAYANKTQFSFINSTSKLNYRLTSSTLNKDIWYHLIVTKNGTSASNINLYLNGVLDQGSIISGSASSVLTNPLTIGATTTTSSFANATIDDVRIYNRSLSPEQIKFLFNNKSDMLSSQETNIDDVWNIELIVNDGVDDSNNITSNYLEILGIINNKPNISNVVLSSSNGGFTINENLTISFDVIDLDNDNTKNITNLYLNNQSLTVLNIPFEGNNGSENNEAKDYSGNNNNGTIYGALWNATGGNDTFGAYRFGPVVDDYIRINDSNTLDFPYDNENNFTIEFLIYSNDIMGTHQGIVSKSGNYFVRILKTNEGINGNKTQFAFVNSTSRQNSILSNTQMQKDKWYHIVAVKNGTSYENLNLYIDGVLETKTGAYGAAQYLLTNPLTIGSTSTSSDFFNGTIDDVKIYNRSLSKEQIQLLYKKSGFGPVTEDSCDDTVGWHNSDQGTNPTKDGTTKKEGSFSLNMGKNGTSSNTAFYNKTINMNLSEKSIYVWGYVQNKTKLRSSSGIRLFLSETTANYYYKNYDISNLRDVENDGTDGWNLLGGNIHQFTTQGTPNPSNIKEVKYGIYTTNNADTIPHAQLKMDYWYVVNMSHILVSQELKTDDYWYVNITANDGIQDSASVSSNAIVVL